MGKDMRNIVLIGMPGVGKTTVAKLLQEKTWMPHYEIDREIEKSMKMTIPEIFDKYGEQGFRQFESASLSKFASKEGGIIDTGGKSLLDQPSLRITRYRGQTPLPGWP